MIPMTLPTILAYLRQNHYSTEMQAETQQIYTILKLSNKEYPLFLRILDEGHLLQLLVFIPAPFKKEVLCDLARLLHLLNKELDLPGFGLDEMAGAIFYRLMLPAQRKEVDQELLLAFIKTIEHVCKTFANPIEAVAYGQMSLDEILKKVKEMES